MPPRGALGKSGVLKSAGLDGSGAGKRGALAACARIESCQRVDSTRHVSLAELADAPHNGNAWTAIGGVVYDVGPFIASGTHPGGAVVRLSVGRDATELFDCYHGLGSADRVAVWLTDRARVGYVGTFDEPLAGTAGSRADPRAVDVALDHPLRTNAFYMDLKARVEQVLRDEGLPRHPPTWWCVMKIVVLLAAYVFVFYKGFCTGPTASLAWPALLGVLISRAGFIMHHGNHASFSSNRWVNAAAAGLMDFSGANYLVWQHEHNVAHHLSPNELGHDNDCEIGEPFTRMHPDLPQFWWTRFQAVTALLGMTTVTAKWAISDILDFARNRVGNIHFYASLSDWASMLFWKGTLAFRVVLLPLWLGGGTFQGPEGGDGSWSRGLCARYGLASVVASLILAHTFVVNHIQEGLVPEDYNAHWAVKQVQGSANWSSGSVFANAFSGGLNHQIEHHLFPQLSYLRYPRIAPAVRAACAAHGLTYRTYPSFASAWLSFVATLNAYGSEKSLRAHDSKKEKRTMKKKE